VSQGLNGDRRWTFSVTCIWPTSWAMARSYRSRQSVALNWLLVGPHKFPSIRDNYIAVLQRILLIQRTLCHVIYVIQTKSHSWSECMQGRGNGWPLEEGCGGVLVQIRWFIAGNRH